MATETHQALKTEIATATGPTGTEPAAAEPTGSLPAVSSMAGGAAAVFQAWRNRLQAALTVADVDGVTSLLARDCWWRDLLALTWDLGVYRGRDNVAAMLSRHLSPASFTNIHMVTEFGPRFQG